jgi:uncharacterized Tic20 family protein
MRSKPARPGPVTPGPQVASSQADDGPDGAAPVRDAEVTLAAIGYLGAIFLGPVIPLVIYATRSSRRPFLRYHVTRALNLTVTGLLYGLCCLILCGLLLLDSLTVALVVTVPIALALWLTVLRYLIRGLIAANRGERYEVPGWICAQIAKCDRPEPAGEHGPAEPAN